jgi:hypothetical protein
MDKERLAPRMLLVCAVAALLVGLYARYHFALEFNPARHSVVSDSRNYFATAWRMVSEYKGQLIRDTIWPPGTSALLGVLLIRGANMWHAELLLFLFSALSLFCIVDSARILFGRKIALLTCIFASLHIGLYFYSGFFLSETPFIFFLYLGIWLAASASRTESKLLRYELLFASGLAIGLSYSIRTIVLPVFLFALLPFLKKRTMVYSVLILSGFLLVLAPLAHRCTSLSEKFCLGAHNGAMNITLGHYGEKMGINFKDSRWIPSSRVDSAKWLFEEVPHTVYEGPQLLGMMAKEMLFNPLDTIATSAYNVFNLFEVRLWPNKFIGQLDNQTLSLHLYFFFILVVMPALLRILASLRNWSKVSPSEKSAILALGGLCFASALTLGEARYRVPFDGIVILLASLYYIPLTEKIASAIFFEKFFSQIAVLVCLVSLGLIVVISHPGVPLRTEILKQLRLGSFAGANDYETKALEDFPQSTKIVDRRVAIDNPYVFKCSVACRGLKVVLPDLSETKGILISLEDNDEYQIQFFQEGKLVSTNYRGPWFSSTRVFRPYAIPVGPSFRNSKDSYVIITPFFGDRSYRLGHVSLRK